MENWAEIRRLHRSEKVRIKKIARKLGIARNTAWAALASDRPPKYERAGRGSLVDGVEMDVRKLLVEYSRMSATVIAERIGWQNSLTTLKDRIRAVRPERARAAAQSAPPTARPHQPRLNPRAPAARFRSVTTQTPASCWSSGPFQVVQNIARFMRTTPSRSSSS